MPHPPRSSRSLRPLFFLVLVLGAGALTARDWHVSALDGDDQHYGATPATALATLKKAATLVQPGDVVLVGDGIYTDPDRAGHSSVVTLRIDGRPDAWITWKARPGHRPDIRPLGWNGIVVAASYQIVEGFTVVGSNASITLKDSLEDATKPRPNPSYNTNGIGVNGTLLPPDRKPHHVIIRHCTVSLCGGGGIYATETDYLTIEDCLVFDNAWYSRYANSGISPIHNWAHDDAPGYHVVIQRNRTWNNRSLVPWKVTGKLSDGNGIILDVTDQRRQGATNATGDAAKPQPPSAPATTPGTAPATAAAPDPNAGNPQRPVWRGRTLVANNVSAFNGGSGIHAFRVSHADLVNNTTYHNGSVVGYPELFANACVDVVILNNIIVPRPGGAVTSNHNNRDVRWDYNLYPAAQSVLAGAHDLVATPVFVSVRPDLREADFRLRPRSPGIDQGSSDALPPADHAGRRRPKGKAPDRGAHER
ncbi:MAG: right-handed parallel beta-helix repeat-containing protein [Burkholderiales bacterium]|nr:right-handed parallel beta-helix repeat-containing protein [Opitutaceae bacterium]